MFHAWGNELANKQKSPHRESKLDEISLSAYLQIGYFISLFGQWLVTTDNENPDL
jgi:hypothetical protein